MANIMIAALQAELDRWPPEDQEDYEERAAIMEYEGEQERENAEIRAFFCVLDKNRRAGNGSL